MHVTETPAFTTRRQGGLAADLYGVADHRPPLVLLHGMTFNRTTWRPLIDRLERLDPGRQVLNIDLPGHGESPGQDSYSPTGVPALLHRVIEEAGLINPVVAGHSAGALGAVWYAGQYPTSGLVIVDQPLLLGPFAALVRSLKDQLEGPGFAAAFQQFYDSLGIGLLPAGPAELVRAAHQPRQRVVTGYWRAMLDGQTAAVDASIEQALAGISRSSVPCHHVAGDELPPGYREWLTARVPSATFDVWPGSGHFVHLAHPDEFAKVLAATSNWPA
jgi:pimeloyl-ACP methyl ester carboxylesterase